jgi:DoxX-like family
MKIKLMFWISTSIIALMEAIMPLGCWLFAPEYMTFGTRALHYPDYFAYALVVAKILGVLGIVWLSLPQKLTEWAYAGLSFTLIFAFISHAAVDGNLAYMIMPLVFLAILGVSYVCRGKMNANWYPIIK